ncbi:hypothetical protein T35B1_11767 [Salinisphaera shabanensis T35B1]|uniref:hypothetical protein n=1 Tax=Salinisphaera TaxID=180541 RepID=UPI00333F3387
MADPDTNRTPDFWREVYDACRLDSVPEAPCFETFLEDPWHHLQTLGQSDAPTSMGHGFEPLLPAQAAVARRLRLEELDSEQRLKSDRQERMIQRPLETDHAAVLH